MKKIKKLIPLISFLPFFSFSVLCSCDKTKNNDLDHMVEPTQEEKEPTIEAGTTLTNYKFTFIEDVTNQTLSVGLEDQKKSNSNIVEIVDYVCSGKECNIQIKWNDDRNVTASCDFTMVFTSTNGWVNKVTHCKFKYTAPSTPIVPVEGVTVEPIATVLEIGTPTTIRAHVLPNNATDKTVTWSVQDNSLATINQAGTITPIKEGTTYAIAKTNDGGFEGLCKLTIKTTIVHVEGISVSPKSLSLETGENTTLIETITPSNADNKNVLWNSSDSDVAYVDSKGKVIALQPGEATITVTSVDGGFTDICVVTVLSEYIPVESIKLNTSYESIGLNEKIKLIPTILPKDATNKDVVWTSSDETVATVDAEGNVKSSTNAGKAIITVISSDTGVKSKCNIEVTPTVASLTISGNHNVNITSDVTFSAFNEGNIPIEHVCTWTIEDTTLGRFDKNKLILSDKAKTYGGTTKIKATHDKTKISNTFEIDIADYSYFLSDGSQYSMQNKKLFAENLTLVGQNVVLPNRFYDDTKNGWIDMEELCSLKNCGTINFIFVPQNISILSPQTAILDNTSVNRLIVDSNNETFTSQDANGNQCDCVMDKQRENLYLGCFNTNIPEGIVNIPDYSFTNNPTLEQITIPDSCKTIGKIAFFGCSHLKDVGVTFGHQQHMLTYKDNDSPNNKLCVWAPNNSLQAKNGEFLANNVTTTDYVISDEYFNFITSDDFKCSLKSNSTLLDQPEISIPDLYKKHNKITGELETYEITNIGESGFEGVEDIVKVDMSENYTVTEIKNGGFHNCTALETFKFSSVTKNFGGGILEGCSNLKLIDLSAYPTVPTDWSGNPFENISSDADEKKIIVAFGTTEEWKTFLSTSWSSYESDGWVIEEANC